MNPFCAQHFSHPEPQGREIALMALELFWPRTAFGIKRNSRWKTEKNGNNFLGGGKPLLQKFTPEILQFFFHLDPSTYVALQEKNAYQIKSTLTGRAVPTEILKIGKFFKTVSQQHMPPKYGRMHSWKTGFNFLG